MRPSWQKVTNTTGIALMGGATYILGENVNKADRPEV